jgi:hypothetical protein
MRLLPFILFVFALSFAEDDKRREMLGTINVSRVHAMDEVKGTYKSPRKAMFMSLVLPGSGQFYVGGKPSRYIRGASYLTGEIALISALYYNSIYKYDKQVKKYENFADSYFIIEDYEAEMVIIKNNAEDREAFQEQYGGTERENYCKALYGSVSERCIDFTNNPPYPNPYDSQAFYRIIANEIFISGWKDDSYNDYVSMRKRANRLADMQAWFLGAIILNHIVSAVDAALSARAHNNSLYEEKISFLDKVRIGSDFDFSESFKVGAGLWYSF